MENNLHRLQVENLECQPKDRASRYGSTTLDMYNAFWCFLLLSEFKNNSWGKGTYFLSELPLEILGIQK